MLNDDFLLGPWVVGTVLSQVSLQRHEPPLFMLKLGGL